MFSYHGFRLDSLYPLRHERNLIFSIIFLFHMFIRREQLITNILQALPFNLLLTLKLIKFVANIIEVLIKFKVLFHMGPNF